MQIKRILTLIDKLEARLAVLLCHHNADPDAIGAAYAFKGLLRQLRPKLETQIGVASGPSRLSKSIINHLKIEITDHPQIEKADLIFLIDTNTIQQLNKWSSRIKSNKPLIVIDHHASHPKTERISTLLIADETASSTCVIIYRLFKEADIEPSPVEAKALFLGIAFDTRHFILATSETLKVIADLTEKKVDPQETLQLLSLPMDFSERIARLKAANRVKILRINVWLIAIAHISAYQASAARGLIALGADVAVVAGKKGNELQVSFRASHKFFSETDVHMGRDLATPIGEFLEGMGGGHSISAGANGVGEIISCLKFCEKLLKKKLS
ncbi:DHH family phosphoesterase [Candidatus Bathyarchaeota archaeon]|nr:DHH family phosphoesterase [Candidatus Bathyarchaeota archaeon]